MKNTRTTKKGKPAMTLAEILMVVILIGILAGMGVVNYQKTIVHAKQKEAKAMVQLLQHAEEVRFIEMNSFIACAGNGVCNTALNLNLPTTATWTYTATLLEIGHFYLASTGSYYLAISLCL